MIENNQRQFLLKLAREAIKAQLEERELNIVCPEDKIYNEKRGIFVSLHIDDQLRGCIGYIKAYYTVFLAVKEMAVAAAFQDPRFPPLTEEEFGKIEIEISILSPLIRLDRKKLDEEIIIGRDGLYIESPYGSGLLLPQVAVEYEMPRKTFLEEVCRKAGLPPKSYFSEAYNLYRFTAEVFSESD